MSMSSKSSGVVLVQQVLVALVDAGDDLLEVVVAALAKASGAISSLLACEMRREDRARRDALRVELSSSQTRFISAIWSASS